MTISSIRRLAQVLLQPWKCGPYKSPTLYICLLMCQEEETFDISTCLGRQSLLELCYRKWQAYSTVTHLISNSELTQAFFWYQVSTGPDCQVIVALSAPLWMIIGDALQPSAQTEATTGDSEATTGDSRPYDHMSSSTQVYSLHVSVLKVNSSFIHA